MSARELLIFTLLRGAGVGPKQVGATAFGVLVYSIKFVHYIMYISSSLCVC